MKGSSTSTTASRRARLLALGLSLVLHAGVATLVLRARPAPMPPSEEPAALEIEIRESEIPPAAEPMPTEPPPSPDPVAPERPRAAEPRPERRRFAPPVPPAPPRLEEPTSSGPRSSLRMRPPGAPLALTPSFEMVDRLTQEGVIAPPDPNAAPAPRTRPGPPRFSERLAALERRDRARANVDRGQVDPQIFDYLRDAQKGFVPPRAALDNDRRAPNTVGRSLKQWVGGLLRPHGDAEDQRQMEPDQGRARGPDVLNRDTRASMRRMGAFLGLARGQSGKAEPMQCLVCVVVRAGRAPEVVLDSSSGNAELDRAAVDSLEQATRTRAVESYVRPQKSCYRFRATVQRVPPVPVIGCNFDEVTLKAGCVYPTQKVYKTTVELESVDYEG
jgi:hypothetical protein